MCVHTHVRMCECIYVCTYVHTHTHTHTHTPNHSRWGQRPGSTTAAPPPSRLSPLPHGASSRPRAWTRPAGCVCLGLCVCVCARAWMVVLHIKHACIYACVRGWVRGCELRQDGVLHIPTACMCVSIVP